MINMNLSVVVFSLSSFSHWPAQQFWSLATSPASFVPVGHLEWEIYYIWSGAILVITFFKHLFL